MLTCVVQLQVPVEEEEAQGEEHERSGDGYVGNSPLCAHDVAKIVEGQASQEAHGGQVRGEVPLLVGCIEHHGEAAKGDHDDMLVAGLPAQVDGDVHQ